LSKSFDTELHHQTAHITHHFVYLLLMEYYDDIVLLFASVITS